MICYYTLRTWIWYYYYVITGKYGRIRNKTIRKYAKIHYDTSIAMASDLNISFLRGAFEMYRVYI